MARAMKDSGIEWIGEIPAEWEIHRVSNYFDERKNRNFALQEQNLLSLSYGKIVQKDINTVGGLLPASFNTYNIVEAKDIIIRPTDLQNDWRSLRTGLVTQRGIITAAYIALKPKPGVYSAYFHYLLHAYDVAKVFYNMGNGVRQGLNYSEFARLLVFSPSIDVQQAIVEYLNARCADIDALVADVQAQIETLEQYKRSVITKAVTKGLNPNVPLKAVDSVWITEIPAIWQFMKAGYLFVERSVRAKGNETPLSLSQKDGLVITDEMTEHAMKSKTYDGWKKVWVNDLVLNRFKAHLGVFFCSKYNGMVSFHYGVYVPLSKLNVKFYEYLFHSKPYCEMFADLSNGITVGLQNLGNANFYSAKCVYPSPAEQDRIVEYLDAKCAEIDAIIDGKRQQLTVLEEYKKSVIFEYVTGKKEVPVA